MDERLEPGAQLMRNILIGLCLSEGCLQLPSEVCTQGREHELHIDLTGTTVTVWVKNPHEGGH